MKSRQIELSELTSFYANGSLLPATDSYLIFPISFNTINAKIFRFSRQGCDPTSRLHFPIKLFIAHPAENLDPSLAPFPICPFLGFTKNKWVCGFKMYPKT